MPQFKPYLLDLKTIIASPHKVYGPGSDDLAWRLREYRVAQVVLAGMSANLCLELSAACAARSPTRSASTPIHASAPSLAK